MDDQHRYWLDGIQYPSVSAIIRQAGLGPAYGGVDPAVLAAAANRGTRVHEWTEAFDKHQDGPKPHPDYLSVDIKPYCEAWTDFRVFFEPIEVEVARHSHYLDPHYAGTIDRVGLIGQQHWLLDIKTTSRISHEAQYQLAAYRRLFDMDESRKIVPLRTGIIHLRKDGSWKLYESQEPEALGRFLEAARNHKMEAA